MAVAVTMKVAWISDFPLEWLPDLPDPLRHLPREHPATWQMVLLQEFEKRTGLILHVIILRKRLERDFVFQRNNVVFHVLKVPRAVRAPFFFWVDTIRIRRKLSEIRPDVVHAWGMERGAGLIASRLGYPYLVTIQGLLTWYKQLVPLRPYERFATFLEKVSLKRCRLATTESKMAVQFLKTHFPELAVQQVEHASNWNFHHVIRQPQITPMRLVSIGTPGFRKGTDLFLKAANRLVGEFDFEIILIGTVSESYLESQKEFISDELRRRMVFRKNLTPGEVARELAIATVMVLPTRADTSPNAVKEAVVAGVPVVASDVGGIPDYVFPGKNGLLVPPGNLEKLIEALREIRTHPQFGQGKVDLETLSATRAYLSPRQMDEQFFAAYQETLRHFKS